MTIRRNLLATAALMAAAIPLTSGLALANPAKAKPQLMFVQTAEDMEADDKTLRLINIRRCGDDTQAPAARHMASPV